MVQVKGASKRRAGGALIGLVLGLGLFAAPAFAEEQPQQASSNAGLAAVLRGLEWNAPKKDVLKFFQKQKDDEFKAQSAELRDPVLKEKLRQKKADEFKRISESDVAFKGKNTGFEVSVISGEYTTDNNESLLVVRDEAARRYYFFADDRLWKMVVAYDPSYLQDIGFDAFVEQVTSKYGNPDDSTYSAETETLTSVAWKDDLTELRIEDKSEFFNTFTMVFSDRKTSERMAKVRETFGGGAAKKKETVLASDIADIQQESAFDRKNNDVVDSILGGKTTVDLERGRPEDAKLLRVGDASAADAAADSPEAAKKTKKGKKGATGKGDGKGGKTGTGLIIY